MTTTIEKFAETPDIARLSTPEKILLVEELWDSISSHEQIPIPESHKAELDRRLANYQAHKGRLLSLEELQERIEKRK
ncbi:MAG: addiction module protein [Candidatus Sumerlaeota bacterium]|nr:addiction module protein [Candidatus Sumerlaeota bacterium]